MMDRRNRRAFIRPAWIVILLGALLLPGMASAQSTGTVAAQQELRIQELESQISALTGQVEQLSFQVRQLTEKLDRMASDVDFRLSQLEGGGQGDASGAMPAQSGSATGAMTTGDSGMAEPPPAPAAASQAAGNTATLSDAGTENGVAAPTPGSGPKVLGTLSQTEYEAQVARQQNSATAAQQAMDATNQQAAAAQPTGGGETGTGQTATNPAAADQTAAVNTGALPGATADEQYQYAFGLLRQNKYDDAEKALRVFIDQNPEHQLTGNANYWLGETYYVRGDYKKAAITFAQGVKTYPQSGKAPDNMLKLGMALAALGQGKDACLAFNEVGKRYPQASDALKERVNKEQQRNSCR
jgi:tol-pal system protein YbgF